MRKFLHSITLDNGVVQGVEFDFIDLDDLPSGGSAGALLIANNLSDLNSASSARTNLGLGTIATQNANAVAITGGTIDNTPIGNTTLAAGRFNSFGIGLTTSLILTISSVGLSVGRTLSIDVNDGNRTLVISANATISGTNTGDQDLSGLVPKTTTVNGHALSGNITVTASDVGAPSGSGSSTGTNTGDQTAFVAAGGSHAAGIVPDPGATAHSNQPLLLADNASFVLPAGKILATKYVATDQSTTSTTPTDLSTTDDVTFSLDATQTVLVFYIANGYCDTAAKNVSSTCLFDGTEDTNFRNDVVVPGANSGTTVACYGTKSLASGSRTVKIQHYVPGGGTGHWRQRLLVVMLVS